MYARNVTLLFALLVGLGTPVHADILILKDGGHVSGAVTKDGDTRIIITDEGPTLSFAKGEYKRHIFESSVSDEALRDMFDDLDGLVTPVLEATEPSPREFLMTWNEYAQRLGRLQQKRGGKKERPEVPQSPDSATFLFDWTRYVGLFLAVRQSREYSTLCKRRKGSGSLQEYVLYPRVEREHIANALRPVFDAFETCLELAETTDRLVENLPRIQADHDEGIRDAYDEYLAKEGELDGARNRKAAVRSANEALARYLRRVRDMEKDMRRSTNLTRAKVNRFAQVRQLAKTEMAGVRKLIDDLLARPGNRRART